MRALAIACALLLAGCGGDGDGGTALQEAPATAPAPTRAAVSEVEVAEVRARVEAAREQGDDDAERTALQELIALSPDEAAARLRLGSLLIDAHQNSAAVEHLRAVIRLRGKDPQANLLLVHALQAHGRFDEAIAELEKLKAFQEDPEPASRLGWVYLVRGDLAAARAEFDWTLERWPTCASARAGMGALHRRQGELEESRATLEEAAMIAPRNAQVQYELALTWRALGDEPAAQAAMERFEELQEAKAHGSGL